MKFEVKAFDKSGREVTEVVEGADATDATELVRRRGLFVVHAKEARAAAPARSNPGRGWSGGKRLANITAFSRQLSVLVGTGTPLVEALAALERQAEPGPWRAVMADIRQRVEEGKQLSEALERHTDCFDPIARSLIAAGESGGKLDTMLDRLSKLTRQQQRVRGQMLGAMVYPALLVAVSVGVIGLMMGFVLPRFEGLFKTLRTPLPPMTDALMHVSAFVRAYWHGLIIGVALIVAGVWAWWRSPGGRSAFDVLVLRTPQFGKLARSFAAARVARLLGVLLEGHVALLESLRLTRQASGNVLYAELLQSAETVVTKGESVSAALAAPVRGQQLIPPSICEALRSGERSGRLGPVLVSVAEAMDEDNEVLIKAFTGLIEPVILIGLGLVVGGVAVSMFLPLFDLTSAAQGGGR